MRTQRKIIRTTLALLPLIGILMLFATSVNAKTETYPHHSQIHFSYSESDDTGWFTFENPNAPNAKIIGAMYGTNYNLNENAPNNSGAIEGSLLTLAKLANTLKSVTGIPLTYIAIPLWYVFYLFIIELIYMIASLITFIPRKCGEFIGG